ncbi:iron-siderophore ABC transporter substrate-binding protein [Myxacorys almedinensis]|nr:iron-siderophore ABC transporter substrate-binding protein [Myxacorys almedinensis]
MTIHKTFTPKTSQVDCQIVEHAMGKSCISNNPKRIVTVQSPFLGHLFALDIKPIGSTSQLGVEQEELTAKYLSNKTFLGNKTVGIEHIGRTRSPNLEKLLQLKPDLILAWDQASTIYPLLSQISPTVVVSSSYITPNWKENFNFIAKVLKKEAAAQQALNHYYQRIEKLKIALGDRYKGKTISVGGGSNLMFTYAKNSFIGTILDDIGLQRPNPQNVITRNGGIYNISEEKLEEVDGDVFFFLGFSNGDKEAFEKLQQKPLWKKLKLAQQRQVYFVDGFTWVGGNLLAADAVLDDLEKYLVNTP